jgi:hypothetical protein
MLTSGVKFNNQNAGKKMAFSAAICSRQEEWSRIWNGFRNFLNEHLEGVY